MEKEDAIYIYMLYIHSYIYAAAAAKSLQSCQEYYSAVKKSWSNVICSNMDGPRDYHMLSEVNQMEKDKYHMSSVTCEI